MDRTDLDWSRKMVAEWAADRVVAVEVEVLDLGKEPAEEAVVVRLD